MTSVAAMTAETSSVESVDMSKFPDLEALQIAAPLAPKKGASAGAKICPVTAEGKAITLFLGTFENPVRVPFEAGCWEEAAVNTRVNLSLEITDPSCQLFFEALDTKIIELLSSRSSEFFKKHVNADQIRMMFRSSLATTAPYVPTLKVKMNVTDDARGVNVWNSCGEVVPHEERPQLWRNLKVAARISIRSVWLSSNMIGVSLQAEDLLLVEQETAPVFPFKMSD